jgi:hypothetical protein
MKLKISLVTMVFLIEITLNKGIKQGINKKKIFSTLTQGEEMRSTYTMSQVKVRRT